MTNRVYGIDLGTTYSCIAYVDGTGRPTMVPNKEGDPTTPSVVWFESESNIVVGKTAKENADLYPDHVVSMVKRSMGAADWKSKPMFGKSYTPQEVSAFILRKVVEDARETVGEEIKDVVITCPAYFGENERQATRQAGMIAGLNVRAIINEPTAAALAYGMTGAGDQTVLVYDLGGGTFDVTVITIANGNITVIATDGDHHLGGCDWDERLVRFFASRFEAEHGVKSDQLFKDKETYNSLRKSAEKVKMMLSSAETVKERVTHEGDRTLVEATRSGFEELTRDLLERTISLTQKALSFAEQEKGVKKADIDRVLLVGGSTKMPQVERRVKELFPNIPVERRDPDQIVAKGAALYALREQIVDELGVLLSPSGSPAPKDKAAYDTKVKELAVATGVPAAEIGRLSRMKVTNITSHSFGMIALIDPTTGRTGLFNLIHKGRVLPFTKLDTTNFGTSEDGQREVGTEVRENSIIESDYNPQTGINPELGTKVGELQVQFPAPLPKHSPLHVSFTMNEEGLLVVTATEPKSGAIGKVEIQTKSVMSEADLNAAKARNTLIAVS